MPKSKRPKDQLAKILVDSLTSDQRPTELRPQQAKNPAAVALGRLGGLKGGKARAEKLSAKKRKEIARLAAQARWKNSQ